MKDGNLTVLYIKEARKIVRPALWRRSRQNSRAAEQQALCRSLCRSRDTPLRCLGAGCSKRRRLSQPAA
jgi:hypothetical protein